jgi:hypothetical protein
LLTEEMAQMYVSQHPYAATKNETDSFYQGLVLSNTELIKNEGLKLWEGCASLSQNNDESPSGNFFRLSSGYLVSSLYNCLNANLPDAIKGLVRQITVDGHTLQHAKEEIILTDLATPIAVNELKKIYEQEKIKEKDSVKEFIASDNGAIREKILSDLDWVGRNFDAQQIMAGCKQRGYKHISFLPVFHEKSELFESFLENITCANVQGSKEYAVIKDNALLGDRLVDTIEEEMKKMATERVQVCLDQYPMGNILNRVRHRLNRESCLKTGWYNMEEKVLENMTKNPQVIKLKVPRDAFQARLDSARSSIQRDLIGTYFAIY